MKKLSILVLALATFPSYADIFDSLSTYQKGLTKTSSSGSAEKSSKPIPEVKNTGKSEASSTVECLEDDQTSLTLEQLTSLMLEENASLDIVHDPRSNTLSVSAPNMVGNCSSMLEWTLNKPEIQGRKAYALEVKFKKNDECKDEGCTYKVAKYEKGEFQKFEEMVFKPTLNGFKECMKASGVVDEKGKVQADAIHSTVVNHKFPNVAESGELYLMSHAPKKKNPKYGKFEHINTCDFYEAAHPEIKSVLSFADAERMRLDAEARRLKDCKEYPTIKEFVDNNEKYAGELGQIMEKLLYEAVVKSAAAIESGKYDDKDLKVLQDYEQYIVNPKIQQARLLSELIEELDGEAKKAKQEELNKLRAEINKLNLKPNFTSAHTMKLMQDGRFAEAEAMNNFNLLVEHHKHIGQMVDNVKVTAAVAKKRIDEGRARFTLGLPDEKLRYEFRTGQRSGKAKEFATLSQQMKSNIQTRAQNYIQSIQAKEMELAPGGYCDQQWWRVNNCKAQAQQLVTQWKNELMHFTKVDAERAAEFEVQAKEFAALEAEGKRYIAAQNGEPVPETAAAASPAQGNNLSPTMPTNNGANGVYSFDLTSQQQQMAAQQAMMTPQNFQNPMVPGYNQNMFQGPMNPFQQQMMQQQFLGQQAFPYQQNTFGGMNTQGTYGFNLTGNQQQMPMQMPYGQQQFAPGMGMIQQPQFGFGQQQFGFAQQQFGQMPFQLYNQQNGIRY